MSTTIAEPLHRGKGALQHSVEEHPVPAFFVLTYMLSWTAWLVAATDPDSSWGQIAFLAGIFGPAAAGLLLTLFLGDSFRDWLAPITRWRVPVRWYLIALLLPMVFPALTGVLYGLLGNQVDYSWLAVNLAGYIPGLLFVALLGGGNEEPGWRGFALPRMEQRYGPVLATLVLGLVWAAWHLPALLASPDLQHEINGPADWAFVITMSATNILCDAFLLTWVYNNTRSVLVTLIMHASFNTANATFIPLDPSIIKGTVYQEVQILMTLVLLVAVFALILFTRGRLGYELHTGNAGEASTLRGFKDRPEQTQRTARRAV